MIHKTVLGMESFMFDESGEEKPSVPDSVLQNLLLKVRFISC